MSRQYPYVVTAEDLEVLMDHLENHPGDLDAHWAYFWADEHFKRSRKPEDPHTRGRRRWALTIHKDWWASISRLTPGLVPVGVEDGVSLAPVDIRDVALVVQYRDERLLALAVGQFYDGRWFRFQHVVGGASVVVYVANTLEAVILPNRSLGRQREYL